MHETTSKSIYQSIRFHIGIFTFKDKNNNNNNTNNKSCNVNYVMFYSYKSTLLQVNK